MEIANKLMYQLIVHEGITLKPVLCPAGKLTIGVGRNLEDNGISRSEALYLLENDISEAQRDLQTIFSCWSSFKIGRLIALIDLYHNLGPGGFRSFKRMISAIKAEDWALAAAELEDSKWWRSELVSNVRKELLRKQLLTGREHDPGGIRWMGY